MAADVKLIESDCCRTDENSSQQGSITEHSHGPRGLLPVFTRLMLEIRSPSPSPTHTSASVASLSFPRLQSFTLVVKQTKQWRQICEGLEVRGLGNATSPFPKSIFNRLVISGPGPPHTSSRFCWLRVGSARLCELILLLGVGC